ncbi:MAG: NFYB/HAP3 family transcription factor subunit [Candidatus Diapherotrites archaeon]|nr:NFYB/HAP3 family transcription factor subunit [Candidatus Diapherotrites archaeon]
MAELLVVTSKVKEIISKEGMNTAGDAPEALSKVVEEMIKKACERAKANGRKTVRPEDF